MKKIAKFSSYTFKNLLLYFNKNAMFLITIGYLIGTLTTLKNNFSFLIPVGVLAIFLHLKSKILILGAIALSLYINSNFVSGIDNEANKVHEQELTIEGRVLEKNTKDYFDEFIIQIPNAHTYVLVEGPKYSSIVIGNKVEVQGRFEGIDNFSGFDYREYLLTKRIGRKFKGSIKLKDNTTEASYQFNQTLSTIINRKLDEPAASLALGILVGKDEGLSEEVKEIMKKVGLSHITSVSGYNFTIIFSLIFVLAGLVNRKLLFICGIILSLGYLYIVGLSNLPAQRAAIMIIIISIGYLLGRKINYLNLLSVAALMIILDFPYYLLSVSFQLSFAATFGLFILSSNIKEIFIKIPGFINEILSSSISVMTFSIFIIIPLFGDYPAISIISNLLVLPFVPLITFTALAAVISDLLSLSIISKLLFNIISILANFAISTSQTLSRLELDTISNILIILFVVFAVMYLIIKNSYKHHYEDIQTF